MISSKKIQSEFNHSLIERKRCNYVQRSSLSSYDILSDLTVTNIANMRVSALQPMITYVFYVLKLVL